MLRVLPSSVSNVKYFTFNILNTTIQVSWGVSNISKLYNMLQYRDNFGTVWNNIAYGFIIFFYLAFSLIPIKISLHLHRPIFALSLTSLFNHFFALSPSTPCHCLPFWWNPGWSIKPGRSLFLCFFFDTRFCNGWVEMVMGGLVVVGGSTGDGQIDGGRISDGWIGGGANLCSICFCFLFCFLFWWLWFDGGCGLILVVVGFFFFFLWLCLQQFFWLLLLMTRRRRRREEFNILF